jgi:hypothetical protein
MFGTLFTGFAKIEYSNSMVHRREAGLYRLSRVNDKYSMFYKSFTGLLDAFF